MGIKDDINEIFAIADGNYIEYKIGYKISVAEKNINKIFKKEYKKLLKWLKKLTRNGYRPYLKLEEIENIIFNQENIEKVLLDKSNENILSYGKTLTNYQYDVRLEKSIINLIVLNIMRDDSVIYGIKYDNATKIIKRINEDYNLISSTEFYEYFQETKYEDLDIIKKEKNWKHKIKVLTDNITKNFDLTEVDKFKIGFESDILFSINTSDNYEEYDLDLVNSNLEDYKLGKIIDISLLKKIGTDGNNLKITNLKNNIKLSYKLDETLIGTSDKIYKMLRVHNGQVSLLDATFDSNTNELLFETDKFSTYAILYKDYKPNSNVPNPKKMIILFLT